MNLEASELRGIVPDSDLAMLERVSQERRCVECEGPFPLYLNPSSRVCRRCENKARALAARKRLRDAQRGKLGWRAKLMSNPF